VNQKSFIAQVAHLETGKSYSVASIGLFDPGKSAARILTGLQGGNLFAYLFRRFGYPDLGWDSHKDLVNYLLTIPMADVFLYVCPYMGTATSSVQLMFGYGIEQSIADPLYRMHPLEVEKHPIYKQAMQAMEVAIRDLLRPVYVRDVPINCYGCVPDEECDKLPKAVEPYHAAGYCVPSEFYQDTDRWEQFCDALEMLGNGDFGKGMDCVIRDLLH